MARSRRRRNIVSRNNFDEHWLQAEDPCAYDQFEHLPISEVQDSRSSIEQSLHEAILDHHIDRRRVANLLDELGHERTSALLAEEMPRNPRTRKGNFGEVVASEHLIQRHKYDMPFFKLRFRDEMNLPMRGEDIVAFRMNRRGRIARIILGEAKAVVRFRRSTVRDAHDRLKKTFLPRPLTLVMLAQLAYNADNVALGREIDRVSDRLARRDFPRAHWIFLINEVQPERPFDCLEEDGDVIESLRCVNIQLDDLTEFVDSLFERAVAGDAR